MVGAELSIRVSAEPHPCVGNCIGRPTTSLTIMLLCFVDRRPASSTEILFHANSANIDEVLGAKVMAGPFGRAAILGKIG